MIGARFVLTLVVVALPGAAACDAQLTPCPEDGHQQAQIGQIAVAVETTTPTDGGVVEADLAIQVPVLCLEGGARAHVRSSRGKVGGVEPGTAAEVFLSPVVTKDEVTTLEGTVALALKSGEVAHVTAQVGDETTVRVFQATESGLLPFDDE